MANPVVTSTLPDSANKADFYAIINSATVTGIANADIAADAAIADTKLAAISTAGKVSGAALTSLANIPSGAGVIPAANLTAIASQAEAEAGSDNAKMMTALRTAQAITALVPTAKFYVGVIAGKNMADASGDTAYTGVGFTPKSMLFFAQLRSTQGMSIGASNITTKNSISTVSAGTWLTAHNAFAFLVAVDGSNFQSAQVKSFDADGFTLTYAKTGSPTGTADILYIAQA